MAINEIGTPGGVVAAYDFQGRPYFAPDSGETTAELRWPYSIAVYDAMRRTDSQIAGNIRAMSQPILSANWTLNTEGVADKVVKLVTTELGLALNDKEARQRRRREGVVWKDHLRTALLSVIYGHMPFEQVYKVSPPTKDQEDIGLPMVAHLQKLSPRFPRTLTEIHVAEDGGLVGITQEPVNQNTVTGYRPKFIPVDRLVYYCIDREGGDWTGVSVLRPTYKHWMIRDVLIRLSAQIVERNGMGVPDMVYDGTTTTKSEAEAMVRNFRAGATGGMVRTPGTTFSLIGVTGTTVDPLPVIAYHDQAVSKAMLAMFLDLGHDTGARSLGDTFVDFFTASLQALADQIAETATEHIIRDLVEENFGPDEPYPVLTPGDLASQAKVTVATLASLTNAGLITPDGTLEDSIRTRFGLPEVDESARPEDPITKAARLAQEAAGNAPGTPPGPATGPKADAAKAAADKKAADKKDAKDASKPDAKKVTNASEFDLVAYARELMARIEESAAGHADED